MIRWQKYLGMREEGRLRAHYFMNGAFVDAVCLGILADEFRADALPKMKALIAAGRAAGRR
jgi:diamine N-acetyltransferase